MSPAARSIREEGIATIWLDQPDKPVNTFTLELLEELDHLLTEILRDNPTAIVFASAKPRSFIAGADLEQMRRMSGQEIERFLIAGQSLFDRIAHLGITTVAAINGDCLGGGCELALACDYRVSADSGTISIGLPETKLGIIPGWGGTVRLPRTVGLTHGLDMMLGGKTLAPSKALAIGLVDEVVRPEALHAAALRLARQRPRRRKLSMGNRLAARIPAVRNLIFHAARKKVLSQTHGNYPAPLKLIETVRSGYDRGISAGLAAERLALMELRLAPSSQNLMRLFFLRGAAKKNLARRIGAPGREVKYAAVIGAGTMGAGIIHALIRAGIEVRLIEADPAAVSAGLGRVRKLLDDDMRSGRLNQLEARKAFNRVVPSTELGRLDLADIVIEAVVEQMPVKREVFAKLDQQAKTAGALASNTSSLSIAAMAEATTSPGRVIGLHFFNPVNKMPLVEIVRTPSSDNAALGLAAGLCARMGKTAILVKDSPGFLVNRILIPYLQEALQLAIEGVPIPHIDHVARAWGMPMGPFQLLDEIGLDIGDHVLRSLLGEPKTTLTPMIERGWRGKKSGIGFYVYGKKSRKAKLNTRLNEVITPAESPLPLDDATMADRLIMVMVNEAAGALDEQIVESPDEIDLATVMGLGLAPFRGGLAAYVRYETVNQIQRRMMILAQKFGRRFSPSPALPKLAEDRVEIISRANLSDRPPIASRIEPHINSSEESTR